MEKSATLVAFLVVVVYKTSTGPAVFVYIQIKPQTNAVLNTKTTENGVSI